MKVVSIVGARPQFIKAAPVSKALRCADHQEIMVHTGQHYDRQMSQVFFNELDIPEPVFNLGVGSGTHGWQTGRMLSGIEEVLLEVKPEWVVVYGDTNSTLAGALAACKLRIPLAHIEAGLRSFNRAMPEEHNRVLTDHCSDMLFCPTETAVANLKRENIVDGVRLVGDTMHDALLQYSVVARERSRILETLELKPKSYLLATVHRAENTDRQENMERILNAFSNTDLPVIFPLHPRTKQMIRDMSGSNGPGSAVSQIRFIEPVSYLDMVALEENARVILTDSGGIQKEAYLLQVPCITLREETEWTETVAAGWNILVGTDETKILAAVQKNEWPRFSHPIVFGDGNASSRIVRDLMSMPHVRL